VRDRSVLSKRMGFFRSAALLITVVSNGKPVVVRATRAGQEKISIEMSPIIRH
jgi:hypothetical protein